jgi:hypothetical protein
MQPAPTTSAEFGALINNEIDKVSNVLKKAGAIPH